jgi:hypothetical protein
MRAALVEAEIVAKTGKPVSGALQIKHYPEVLERPEDADEVALLKTRRKLHRTTEDML